ncbi:MAG TPA: M3 family metallopeptidase [Usitatibacter sp.]|nr:M3 family metallopeptidase [Usitatibacter sp.]
MRHLIALAAAAAALNAFAAPPAASTPARPLLTVYDAAGIKQACDDGLAGHRKAIAAMDARKGPGTILDEWNHLSIDIEDVINTVYLLSNVHPDQAVRDAAEPCLSAYTALQTEIFQDEKLYARVNALQPANPHQAKMKKDLMEGFEDSGVALPPRKRARAKEIFDRLEVLRQDFDRAIRDDKTKVTFTAQEMQGMPESYLKSRKPDEKGNYVLGLDYPSYFPFLQNARNGEARQRYYVAKLNEGGQANLDRMYEIFKLRQELAGLYGLPSFADYALRRKMVQNPRTVMKFLDDVKGAVTDLEKKEIEEIRAEKAKDLGTPVADTRVDRWDVSYYQERIRRARFDIDQEELRKYFPTDKAVDYTLLVSQRLYGLEFREVKVATWHPDVRYFDVFDAKTGKFMSGFYLDLFPREGKFNHAAAFPIRGASLLAHRTPLAALVTNFNREGLDHGELETLMHEFGHVMHNVLSRTDYNPEAGTSVKGDFVEAPSQMFEEWARREQPLELFKQVCPDCPHLTHDEIARLDAARRYGQGTLYARQWLYASFDMAMSTDPQPPLAVWTRLESATPLGHPDGTMFPASFSHIASNYGAGYYGYMWSQVLALDMLSPFKKNMMDSSVGRRYRETILAQGGQDEEMNLVKRFLGRNPSNQAFFAEITGKR